ncbi:MAG TPA: hypothetical protein VFH31_15520 [Pyrinomonadaceae bacterium]|nr:hypothetical protein [Pyrinomonadaceae bacterium]
MLGGLDYHHDNFISRLDQLAPYYERYSTFLKNALEQRSGDPPSTVPTDDERGIFEMLNHEAVAYLNRLGQFYYFAKALKVNAHLPRAYQLMLFRNKHTAHRSIDAPLNEDSDLREVHATAFSFHQLSVASFPVFQIRDNQQVVEFHMRDDHVVLMQQAFDALQAIHLVRT